MPPPQNRNPLPVLGKVFSLLGLGFLLVAGVMAAVQAPFVSSARTADGLVVHTIRTGRSYVPEVEFTPPDHEPVRFRSTIGSRPPAFRTGQRVQVLYDPAEPTHAAINEIWQLWFFPGLFGMIGSPFFVLGVVFTVLARRARLK